MSAACFCVTLVVVSRDLELEVDTAQDLCGLTAPTHPLWPVRRVVLSAAASWVSEVRRVAFKSRRVDSMSLQRRRAIYNSLLKSSRRLRVSCSTIAVTPFN
jgi:hypothetical protein